MMVAEQSILFLHIFSVQCNTQNISKDKSFLSKNTCVYLYIHRKQDTDAHNAYHR